MRNKIKKKKYLNQIKYLREKNFYFSYYYYCIILPNTNGMYLLILLP